MLKLAVADGAVIKCLLGSTPSQLTVTTDRFARIEGSLIASVYDYRPGVNVKPFGVCAITGGPCVPAPMPPWKPGEPSILLVTTPFPLLSQSSVLACAVGGIIYVSDPGQGSLYVDSPAGAAAAVLDAETEAGSTFLSELLGALGQSTLEGLVNILQSLARLGVLGQLGTAFLDGAQQYLRQRNDPDCEEDRRHPDDIFCRPHLEPPNEVPRRPPPPPPPPVPVEPSGPPEEGFPENLIPDPPELPETL